MVLTQILKSNCVKVPLEGTDKDSVIRELVELLDSNRLLLDKDVVMEAVFTRERTRSTGIGSGIAIPHGKMESLASLLIPNTS